MKKSINLRVEEDLYRKAKLRALYENTTISKVVEAVLKRYAEEVNNMTLEKLLKKFD